MKQYTCKRLYFFFPAAICCMLLQMCLPGGTLGADNISVFPAPNALTALAPDYTVDDSFTSHLPILVLEATGEEASPEGAPARVTVYADSGGSPSFLTSPKTSVNIVMRKEAGQDSPAKATYILELADSSSVLQQVPLAGLPAGNRWRLQGSTRDKGMLRNGIAYALGRSLFPQYTPETRYCEVLIKENGIYRYDGLYILSQSMEQLLPRSGGDRGQTLLIEYTPAMDKTSYSGGQMDEEGIVFGLSLRDRGFSVVYPRGDDDGQQKSTAEIRIDEVETVLRSLKPGTYLKYSSLLDQRSAIDFYIFNALMLNAHEDPLPLYLVKQGSDGFAFMPVWNFDASIDNVSVRHRPLPFEQEPLRLTPPSVLERRMPVWRQLENGGDIRNLRHYPVYQIMDADHFLWFDRLFLSRPFLMGLFSRYHELRRGPLAPERVTALVDGLATSLGPALERDWKRWEKEYTAASGPFALMPFTDDKGEEHLRQTFSYDQELVKIRHNLLEQDSFLMGQTSQLNWISADLFDEATSGNRQGAYAFVAIIGFLILTYLLTRKL